jgi:7,8-dihydropterin-6-yl-methyl-4-(beta-D-ribofuranosyl)aminobenzene 5'-phosphate synthase
VKKITCLVDNSVQRGSPFWGEHGLAFWIETEGRCALFDTGQSGTVLQHNLDLLGLNPREADVAILSHAHLDHTGGVDAILSLKPDLPVYARPDIFRPRFSFREGEYKSIGLPRTLKKQLQTADLNLSEDPIEVLPGLWTSGEISERPEREGRSPHHYVPHDEGWKPDPYQDDMSLVMDTGEGIVLICGCCHAGLLNTMAHVWQTFQRPILAVLGGTHLTCLDGDDLCHVVEVIRENYAPIHFYLNHCTGEQAYVALTNAFIGQVKPCPVGTILRFDN